MLYLVILLISPRRWSIISVASGMLLIPSGNRADRPLLS